MLMLVHIIDSLEKHMVMTTPILLHGLIFNLGLKEMVNYYQICGLGFLFFQGLRRRTSDKVYCNEIK